MVSTNVAYIDFEGQQLVSLRRDGLVRVALRPIAAQLGLDWSWQLKKIKEHPIFGPAVALEATATTKSASTVVLDATAEAEPWRPAPQLAEAVSSSDTASGGRGQEMVTLPLNLFHGWMLGISHQTVKEPLRDMLLAYQLRSYDVLADYWSGEKPAGQPAQTATIAAKNLAYRELPKLLKRLQTEKHRESRRILLGLIDQACVAVGIAGPSIEEFAVAKGPNHAGAFFAALARLDALGVAWNHSRDPRRLAVNLVEVAKLFADGNIAAPAGTTLKEALSLSDDPKFIATGAVNSRTGKVKHCWIFAAPAPAD